MTDSIPPSPQMSPPIEPQPPQQVQPKASAWPTVIGVIAIVWASLGLICTPFSLFGNKINPQAQEFFQYYPDWYTTYLTAATLVGGALAVLLLVAGICLLKRVRTARGLHLTYAGASLVLAAVGLVVVIVVVIPSFQKSGMSQAGVIGGIVGAVVGSVIGMAWPVFLLVWFSRGKIRQQVQQW